MSKGIPVKYRIRKRERVYLTYGDASRMEVREYEVSYEEWCAVLKAEINARDLGRAPNVWTVPV